MFKLYRIAATIICFLLFTTGAEAAKPEDVFKGRIIITANRLPTRFGSQGAFIAAVRNQSDRQGLAQGGKGQRSRGVEDRVHRVLRQPLNDNEITVKFWEIGPGQQRYVAGDEQYMRDKASRIFASSIQLAKPDFETNKKYSMTIERGGRVLARTEFWLRGKGANYSGKVEFSDEEAKLR